MNQDDMILAAGVKFVTLANEALKRAGEDGETEFEPTMLKVQTEVKARGGTFVLSYRVVFGPFMLHQGQPSLQTALDALEELIITYGL